MQPMIILYGATASGKTDCALALADSFPIEIINGDMGQAYTPLSIGTAKPANWKALAVPHHLFDSINEPRNMTVIEFRTNVLNAMRAISARGNIPVIVGGSGFYLKSLFFPPLDIQKNDTGISATKEEQEELLEGKSSLECWELLNSIDPERARIVPAHDEYRIKRALAIWFNSGKKPSDCAPVYDPITPFFHIFHLYRERKELYAKIDERVIAMMDQGWIQEVENLTPAWGEFIVTKKIIGYNEILDYISQPSHTEQSYIQLVHSIQKRTRNYAKRQETFWKSFQKELSAEPATLTDVHPVFTEIPASDNSPRLVLEELDNYFLALKKSAVL